MVRCVVVVVVVVHVTWMDGTLDTIKWLDKRITKRLVLLLECFPIVCMINWAHDMSMSVRIKLPE